MPIVFSAFVPHPPLLVPNIGKENLKMLAKTEAAYGKLENALVKINPEIIVIISPHGSIQENNFTINLSPKFTANFEDFGDFETKLNFKGEIQLSYKTREKLETTDPLQLITEKELDHGASIPLYMLTKNLPKTKILPVNISGLTLKDHFEFGKKLRHEFIYYNHTVAVISSGDLSHKLTASAPGGFSSKAKKFDNKLIELLQNKQAEKIISLDSQSIKEAETCGLRSLSVLLGILSDIYHEPQQLSYEHPFGVGYLTMNYNL